MVCCLGWLCCCWRRFPCLARRRRRRLPGSPRPRKREAMKDKWPSARQVQLEVNRIRDWNKGRMTQTRFRGKNVEFWPADHSKHSDEEKANGFILGKLVSEGDSKDGLFRRTVLRLRPQGRQPLGSLLLQPE